MSVSQHDWSLHRKGQIDQERHKEKIREAIKKNLQEIVSEESIILSDGKKTVRVPIRSLEEYRFRYDPGRQAHAGQGDGKSRVGDVIAQEPRAGRGKKGEAGKDPGYDYYEAEISMEELSELIFEDLELPNLEQKRQQELQTDAVRFTDIRKHGPLTNLDKKRTILENMKRNATKGEPRFKDIKNEDLRFKVWEPTIRYESNAVVIAMMDVSGSMGEFEKYIARSFYFWMVRFLRTKYNNVHIVFISHHTEAKEVTEEEFFHKGESGGTQVSSAYELALQIIKERFNPHDWNIYPFHFSDGDNLPWDNDRCVQLVQQLIELCNIFGYGEIREGHYRSPSTLMSAYSRITDKKFVAVTISDKKEVYPALRKFFARRGDAVPAGR
ncbi:MAG: sporulation protein YhbH [Thermogemmatispora sp.]|jgi:sporulation protein YhbH|uniref:Sporulation protein YhbH n=1 Tax=Thermogemmatispora aurantia TaxID=2045279 RepID=A0A5J4K718_9CHLR|nr:MULTISPECIES: sporulation protein YhbH [Thermogemmatispora]MBE3566799.1 sporulation protein YhbH [Thermogemmatispora sp.]GER83325.1 sporulation protein YhbH [Thermogemmatispora aurantia]